MAIETNRAVEMADRWHVYCSTYPVPAQPDHELFLFARPASEFFNQHALLAPEGCTVASALPCGGSNNCDEQRKKLATWWCRTD